MKINAWDELMLWLSVRQKGSMHLLATACETLNIALPTHQVRKRLQLLGHIEVSPGAKNWSINPTAWVKQAIGEDYYLVGQRCFKHYAEPALRYLLKPNAPSLILTQNPTSETLESPLEAMLPHLLPIEQWRAELYHIPLAHPPHMYIYEKWNVLADRFEPYAGIPAQATSDNGVYRVKKRVEKTPMDKYQHLLYWGVKEQKWLVADFTGLCFAQRFDNAEAVSGVYDSQKYCLWIPKAQRWSYIYERFLVLATGCLPDAEPPPGRTGEWLHYPGIPEKYIESLEREIMDLEVDYV